MSGQTKSFAETYTMRSTFFRLLGEAGKLAADAYTQADLENQRDINRLMFDALAHALIEFHGYSREELSREPWFAADTAPEEQSVLVWRHDGNAPWIYGVREIATRELDENGAASWYNGSGDEITKPVLWTHLPDAPPESMAARR